MGGERKKAGRSRLWGLGIGLAIWCAGLVGLAGATTITVENVADTAFTEFNLPTANSAPAGITTGPDGALWFTERTGNKIGRITAAGNTPFSLAEFAIPTANAGPTSIATGLDGALWFTMPDANKIGRITTAGTITEFDLPTPNGRPGGIAAGPDGALWFTETVGNKIGRITTAGTITEFALPTPTPNRWPDGITAGPDGALWFTLPVANKIGRITTTGTITEFDLPTPNGRPVGITVGPDGALWFTLPSVRKIGRITTAGTIAEFDLFPPFNLGPAGITAGPDGALWFTLPDALEFRRIGRITTAGTITVLNLPRRSSGLVGFHTNDLLDGITVGPDGALWFTRSDANQIRRIELDLVGDAAVSLNGSVFHMDQTITYEATVTPGPKPTAVDIYVGVLLPDGVTFLSLVQGSSGVISFALGPSPIPYQVNVPVTRFVIPFSYRFAGFEPVGTYVAYARLMIAGSDPLVPANQLGLALRSFQFSADVCLSVSVSGSGSVTSSPLGNGGSGCFAYFAPGTTVTMTAQTQNSTFNGWSGDCASAGTHATCILEMTTNKHVGASFSTAAPSGPGGYACVFSLCRVKLQFTPRLRLF